MASIQSKTGKSGSKTYYVVVSDFGKHKWLKAGSYSDAKKLKRQVERLTHQQKLDGFGPEVVEIRIDDFIKQYLDHVKLHNSSVTVKRYRVILNTFLVFLRMFHSNILFLSKLKTIHLESYQRKRLESLELKIKADGIKRGSHNNKKLPLPQTVNYECNVLRTAFIWAQDHDLLEIIPTKKLRKLKPKAVKKALIFSSEQCESLLFTAKQLANKNKNLKVFSDAIAFLLNTGLRSGELCNLFWSDVDLVTGKIKIQEKEHWSPKTHPREFFMNEICISILKRQKRIDDFVFLQHNGNPLNPDLLRRVYVRLTRKAGFPEFTRVHDLRHTFNSIMQMNGVDPATMGKILGHKDIETTMIYTHQTDKHLKDSISKIGIK